MILFVGEDSSTVAIVAEQLAVFRILRALKMVAKYIISFMKANLQISFISDCQIWGAKNHCSDSFTGISGKFATQHNIV